jgi:adenine C2-methylase RlmN of 23S rRNA A2503 and tRNA A37
LLFLAVACTKRSAGKESAQEAFLAALEKLKVTATLRRKKGHDIDAACGQLRLKTEREQRPPGTPVSPETTPTGRLEP